MRPPNLQAIQLEAEQVLASLFQASTYQPSQIHSDAADQPTREVMPARAGSDRGSVMLPVVDPNAAPPRLAGAWAERASFHEAPARAPSAAPAPMQGWASELESDANWSMIDDDTARHEAASDSMAQHHEDRARATWPSLAAQSSGPTTGGATCRPWEQTNQKPAGEGLVDKVGQRECEEDQEGASGAAVAPGPKLNPLARCYAISDPKAWTFQDLPGRGTQVWQPPACHKGHAPSHRGHATSANPRLTLLPALMRPDPP